MIRYDDLSCCTLPMTVRFCYDSIDFSPGHVMFLGTTSSIESVDPALRRPGRFDREIEIPVPTPNQRLAILKVFISYVVSFHEENVLAGNCLNDFHYFHHSHSSLFAPADPTPSLLTHAY